MKDLSEVMRQEARLIILKELGEWANETLNSTALTARVRDFGIPRERDWVHEQLQFLREEGAVTLEPAGSVLIATLTQRGRRHLDREEAITGVQRPSRPGA